LEWHLTWGEHEAQLEAVQKRSGRPVNALMNRPELGPELVAFWSAFWSLHPTRQSGMGLEPLQPQAIKAWLDIHGVQSIDLRARYYGFVTRMDQSFLRWHREKSAKKEEQS
jgi:hypothetical protein